MKRLDDERIYEVIIEDKSTFYKRVAIQDVYDMTLVYVQNVINPSSRFPIPDIGVLADVIMTESVMHERTVKIYETLDIFSTEYPEYFI